MPVVDREGNETGQYVYHGQVANRARELLGRHLDMFPGKVEHVGKGAEDTQAGLEQRLLEKRTMLLERVWDFHFDPKTNVVETHVSRLRGKVDRPFSTEMIKTIRGSGYVLNVPA